MKSHPFSLTMIVKTFDQNLRYVGYMEKDGRKAQLFGFFGRDLLDFGRYQKADTPGRYYYIDLGQAGTTSGGKKYRGETQFDCLLSAQKYGDNYKQ